MLFHVGAEFGRVWLTSGDMSVLDIGCGTNKVLAEATGLDRVELPGVDVVHDLDLVPYPFSDKQFREVYAHNVLEHVADLMAVMDEIHRILEVSGLLHIKVPYYGSLGAFGDPTHKFFFTEKTFAYFTGDNEISYYTKFQYELVSQSLHANCISRLEKLRSLLPFRHVFKYFLLNMFDEIHVTLRKR